MQFLRSRLGPPASHRSRCVAGLVWDDARGIGLFEVIAGTLIATLAVLGLAYSFGVGRGLIDRYQVARAAMGEAQKMADSLAAEPPASLASGSETFWLAGQPLGTTSWIVTHVDDPGDNVPSDPNPYDMNRLSILVTWQLGGSTDTLGLTRLVAIK
jgi:hypothetical protein